MKDNLTRSQSQEIRAGERKIADLTAAENKLLLSIKNLRLKEIESEAYLGVLKNKIANQELRLAEYTERRETCEYELDKVHTSLSTIGETLYAEHDLLRKEILKASKELSILEHSVQKMQKVEKQLTDSLNLKEI